jgi:MFS family permease
MTPTIPTATPALLAPAERRNALIAIVASAAFVGLTIGYSAPLMALMLEAAGHSQSIVGLNAAVAAASTIVLGPLMPKLFDRFGLYRSILWAVAVGALALGAMALWQDLVVWFVLRFVLGAATTVHWIGSESWLISATEPKHRGKAIALYMLFIAGGFAAGAPLILVFGTDGQIPLLAGAALCFLAAPAILVGRNAAPNLPKAPPAAFREAFRIAPLVIAAALLAGFTDMAAMTHLAIYFQNAGMVQDLAVLTLTVMLLANLLVQLPLGYLADRWNRQRMLIGCGVIFLLVPVVVIFSSVTAWHLWPVLVLWGSASLGIYTLALIILGDRFPPALVASANAAIVAVYQFGSILGQPVGGAGMDLFGNDGLMYVFIAAAALFLGFAAWRRTVER